jgi:hypothetical protein
MIILTLLSSLSLLLQSISTDEHQQILFSLHIIEIIYPVNGINFEVIKTEAQLSLPDRLHIVSVVDTRI